MRRPNVFASSSLDRAHQVRRDEQALRDARAHPLARVALVWRSKSLVRADEPRPALLTFSELEELIDEVEATMPLVWLGLHNERPHFALDLSDLEQPHERAAIARAGDFVDLRQVGAVLEADDGALLAYARAMMSWHRKHLFCGSCGSPTEPRDGGHLRVCLSESCGADSFPRTDPAVIMLAHTADEGHCLLGRQEAWPAGVFSTLAGFVEPGESLENAVLREIFEETGVRASQADYHSSQPWPFPSSIMLGFMATAKRGEVSVDGDELQEARWFERQELLELGQRREVRFPPRMSIARRLIDDWLFREQEE